MQHDNSLNKELLHLLHFVLTLLNKYTVWSDAFELSALLFAWLKEWVMSLTKEDAFVHFLKLLF